MKKRTFFTGHKKRELPQLRKPRSNSNPHDRNEVSKTWYSTDPKDLPDGITVGSMSVPYPPPYLQHTEQQTAEEQFGTFPKKKSKRGKGKKSSEKSSPSPLLASHQKSHESSEKKKLTVKLTKIGSKPLHIPNKNEKFQKMRLQRSCSLDALDEITDLSKSMLPATRLRRTSTEVSKNALPKARYSPPLYSRGISYNPDQLITAKRSLYRKHEQSLGQSYAREISRANPQKTLHKPKSVENLIEAIQSADVDINRLDEETGDAPIHSIVKKKRKDRVDLLLNLLIYSEADVDLPNRRGMTSLHIAVEEGDDMCVKALVAFNANINKQGCNQFTPLDLAIDSGHVPKIEELLYDLGAKSSTQLLAKFNVKVPRLHSFADKMQPPRRGERLSTNDRLSEFINRRGERRLCNELEMTVSRRLSVSATMGGADDAYALVLQQRELALYNRTLRKSKALRKPSFNPEGGSRILFLDGGGIKGLVQLEILSQIEEKAQRPIPELFDWIVGTSTGGILALAMVYAKKSMPTLRKLFFMMKNRIFMRSRYGFGYNSEALEEILKDYLDEDILMSDVTHPKVLIAAVNKSTTNLELNFFNNCFGDDFTDFPIWKVARYTSAAPMFFTEFENYVDGGVICNNPTDFGLTAIQNFCRLQGQKLSIALVVSVGTGIYPAEKMGSIDAQEALFFGKQWFKPAKLMKKTQNLFSLLSNALVESEMIADNSRSRCEEQGIPFYRFSPRFDEVIPAGETDNEKLFNMIIKTKLYNQSSHMRELTDLFHTIAISSKRIIHGSITEEESEITEEANHDEKQNLKLNSLEGDAPEANDFGSNDPIPVAPPQNEHDPVENGIVSTTQVSSQLEVDEKKIAHGTTPVSSLRQELAVNAMASITTPVSPQLEAAADTGTNLFSAPQSELEPVENTMASGTTQVPSTTQQHELANDAVTGFTPHMHKTQQNAQQCVLPTDHKLYKPFKSSTNEEETKEESQSEYTKYKLETLV